MYAACTIAHSRKMPAVEAVGLLDTGLSITSMPASLALAHDVEMKRHRFTINCAETTGYLLANGATIRVAGRRWVFQGFTAMDYRSEVGLGKDFLQGHILDFGAQEVIFTKG